MTQFDTLLLDSFQVEITAAIGGQLVQNTLAEFG
jgi:hypothetical protein